MSLENQVTDFPVIETTLLDGRVALLQPKDGFHAAIDTVFLAAAVPAKDGDQVLDVGCGVGSAGLCVLSRKQNIYLTGIDIQQEMIDLALQNATLNNVTGNCRFFQADLQKEKIIEDNAFQIVMMNPPYQEAGTYFPSPHKTRTWSHAEEASGAKLQDWIKYAHRKLKQGGTLVMIHRADRLDAVIAGLQARRWFGSLVIHPLWPKKGENAKRVILIAKKERYKPIILTQGLIIHEKNGDYTPEAKEILRKGQPFSPVKF
jgi:tRNA1(Val) A37 N6-methylase TrmN6